MVVSNGGFTAAMDPTQVALMEEECILLDRDDQVIGKESKKNCHLNSIIEARNLLHRAFSVFLFNSRDELLLQQRAAEKITFPLVWSNTCCSHPLYVESELDMKDFVGVKRAAIRKLEHELGISPDQIPLSAINVLARVHYKAATDDTWGEHEIDYILFVKMDVKVVLNRNEVNAVKYVTEEELDQMLKDSSYKVSPWFRLIVEKGLLREW
eukprot:CAMPEP_0184658848 /NCGR_PEP_ID=MMETSP0308-20130426/27149_1 /TAXON_ID=38269 /ORGANISM="Gloeochaete witrockiana, Strain SAG 46.84" /LENGTH=210 /DNA_ID=CAMNT_0027098173 /DNA_START=32 /DNA_END=661 /DNA_ORIENTATION=-